MKDFLMIMEGTPKLAWVGLFYGIYVGIKNLRDRPVNVKTLGLIAVVFLGLSLSTLSHSIVSFPLIGLLWLLFFLIGSQFSWHFLSEKPYRVYKDSYRMDVSGSPLFLILFPIIFISKFVYGVSAALEPEILQTLHFLIPFFSVSGIISGILVGRIAKLIWTFYLYTYGKE